MQVLHQGGGAGSVSSTLHLSVGLQRAGFHVRFVCPPGSEVETLAHGKGLEVHPLQLLSRQRRENARRLERLLREHPVHLVNSQSSRDRGALSWLRMKGVLPVPLVVTRRQMPRTVFVENWLVSRLADRVVAVSGAVGEALRRRGTSRKKLVIIPNGLITDTIDIPVPSDTLEAWKTLIGWEPTRRTIGIIARWKDQSVVLRALQRVAMPTRLVLAGVDPKLNLDHLIRQVPPRHAVVRLPFIAQIRPLYELLELVLLPSRIEGLSQGLLEAMALRKPVIASAAGGNLDLIRDGVDGRLAAPLDSAAWAHLIDDLLSRPAEAARLAASAWHTARETYTLGRTVERTSELYRSLLAHG